MDANERALAYQVWQKLSEPRENGAPAGEPTDPQLEAIAELVLARRYQGCEGDGKCEHGIGAWCRFCGRDLTAPNPLVLPETPPESEFVLEVKP